MAGPSSFQFHFAKEETPGICAGERDCTNPTANLLVTEKETEAAKGLTKVPH